LSQIISFLFEVKEFKGNYKSLYYGIKEFLDRKNIKDTTRAGYLGEIKKRIISTFTIFSKNSSSGRKNISKDKTSRSIFGKKKTTREQKTPKIKLDNLILLWTLEMKKEKVLLSLNI
jgi:hypothetical protein